MQFVLIFPWIKTFRIIENGQGKDPETVYASAAESTWGDFVIPNKNRKIKFIQ